MAHRWYWLISLAIIGLTACGQSAAPTSVSAVPPATDGNGPTTIPTRTASGVFPTATVAATGDMRYIDPQGRFSITVPREWQPRPPSGTTPSALVSFQAADGSAGLIIGLEPLTLGTNAKEFAASTDAANATRMTNYKRLGQESLTVGNVPAEALTYQGAIGTTGLLFRQILLAQGTDGWSITFPLDPAARQRYGPLVDSIAQSFTFGTPLGRTEAATDGLGTTGTATSTVSLPASALDWKPNTPIAAGVPVRLTDAGLIAQLNGATFTTKAGGKATLGADEQFLIADMTIWNTGPTNLVPAPSECSVMLARGASNTPEPIEIATDVAGGKAPLFGKEGVAPNRGVRGTLVVRVPKQPGLLILTYQPTATRTPQPVQFYVKP